MLINRLTELKNSCTKEEFEMILEETTRDIKVNRIGFNKRTSQSEFHDILNNTVRVFKRL